MPPYERQVYDGSRGTSRLADLIMRRGDTQARLALERGDIAARTATDLGGIVSGTLSSLVKHSADAKAQQAADARQAEADARRKVEQERQDAAYMQQQDANAKQGMESSALSGALRQNDKGVWSYDMDVLGESLKKSGLGDRLPAIQQRLQAAEVSTMEFTIAKAKLAEHQAKTLGNLAAGVAEAGNSPEAFTLAATLATKNGLLDPDALAPYLEQIQKDPASVKTLTTQLMRQAGMKAETPKEDDLVNVAPGTDVFNKKTGKVVYTNPREFAPERAPDTTTIKPGERNSATRWRDAQFAAITKDAERKIADEAARLRLAEDGKQQLSDADFNEKKRPALEAFKARVYKDAQRQKEDVVTSYQNQLGAPESASPSLSTREPMVRIRTQDGRTGMIPVKNLAAAKAAGAVEVR